MNLLFKFFGGKSLYLSILLVFMSIASVAQNRQKTDKAWDLLLSNERAQAREVFEKYLRKDIDKNIELLLLEAYLEEEEGEIIFDTDFTNKFMTFEEAKYYLYPNWYSNHLIGNVNIAGYNDYTHAKIDLLASDPVLGNDLIVLYHKYLSDKKRRKNEGLTNLSKATHAIDKWQFCGVFENLNDSGLEIVYEPENYAKNDKIFDASSNGKVGWYNPLDKQNTGGYHFYYNEREYGQGIMYAQTFIETDENKRVYLNLGASSSVKIFLNDVEVYRNNRISLSDLNAYRIVLNLQEGMNRLLIKSSTGMSNDYFFVSLTDEAYQPVSGLNYYDEYKSYAKGDLKTINPEPVNPYFEDYFISRLEENPENPLYSINLFNAYLNNGKYEQAEQALKKIYNKYPKSSLLRMLMGDLYAKKGDTQRSKELFENIAVTDKDYYYNLVRLIEDTTLLSSKTTHELEKLRDEQLSNKPKYIYHLLDFIIAGRKLDKEKALESYEAFVEESANSETILDAYASVLYGVTNDRERVIEFLEKRNKEALSEDVISELIRYYNITGKKEKRAELLRDRAERYPYTYLMSKGYIDYLNEEKEYQKVIELTQRGLQNFPYSFVLMEEQGKAYNQIKDIAKAEKLFRKSLSHHTGNTSLRKKLYDITNRQDESEEVITGNLYEYIGKNRNSSLKTDYGVIILLDECIVNVFPEGGQKYDYTYIYEVTSDTGVEYLKEYELGGYGTNILKSEIIKPDGSIVPAERNYDRLVFTNLKPGDVVLVKYQAFENTVGRFFKDITLGYPFRTLYPTELVRYGVIYPKNKTFKTQIVNGEIPHITKTVGEKNYMEWKLEKVQAVPIYEDYSPSLYDVIETLHISTIDSWSDIADWYADLVQKNLEMDKVTINTFNSIFPEGSETLSDEEKAKRIYAYIQDNITYSFLDFRQSGYVPQKPSKTITTKLGDCKDLSALFVTLATHACLDTDLVLVLTNDNGTKSNPLPNIGFNHCIVRVKLDNKEHFMELTDNFAPFNTMPPSLYKANALVVSLDKKKNAENGIIELPFDNTVLNRVEQYSVIDITQELKKTKNTIVLEGYAKSYFNYLFAQSTSEDVRSDELEKLYNSRLNKVIKVHDVALKANDKYDKQLSFSIDFDINDRLQKIGKMRFTSVPLIHQPYTRGIITAEQRKYPIFYPFYENVNHYYSEIIMNIDEGNKFIEIPENKEYTYKKHKYRIGYELLKDNSLKITRDVYTPFDSISVDDYADFKSYVEKIIEDEEAVIAFE